MKERKTVMEENNGGKKLKIILKQKQKLKMKWNWKLIFVQEFLTDIQWKNKEIKCSVCGGEA